MFNKIKKTQEKNLMKNSNFPKKAALEKIAPTIDKLEVIVEKFGGEGVGISHYDGKVVFIPNSVPGDKVLVKNMKETKSYIKGEIIKIVSPSPHRVTPPCPHFGECGGCSHQNIAYPMQLKFKHELLREIFRKFITPQLKVEEVTPSPLEFGYRNKLQMQCAAGKNGKVVAGFYKVRSHDVVPIESCPLHSDKINKMVDSVVSLLNQFKIPPYSEKLKKGMVRHIVIRESHTSNEMILTIVSNYPTLFQQNKISKILFSQNKNLKGFFVYHNPHDTNVIFEDGQDISLNDNHSPLTRVFGDDFVTDQINGTKFKVSPLSFFQVNTLQANNMATMVEKLLTEGRDTSKVSLIDAYAGIGTLSLGLAPKFKSVMALEIVNQACSLARLNAKTARAANFHVRKGDAVELIDRLYNQLGPEKFEKEYPYLILDPPRSGLSEEMTEFLCDVKFKEIVYISCNPHTQARDVEKLVNDGGYKVVKIAPFDMFPHTFHIENIMKLVQK